MNQNPYNDRDKEAYRVAYLVAGYIRNTLTDQEHLELDDWVNASDQNMKLFEDLTDERNVQANLELMDKVQSDNSFTALRQSGAFNKPSKKTRIVWMAAASVILLLGVFFIYRISNNNRATKHELAETDTAVLRPGGNSATLTLPDGKVVDLKSAKNGIIQNSEGSHVSKPVDGELMYEPNAYTAQVDKFHTLSTPVGGQFRVTLPDGTQVWLNSSTTLRYPSQFSANERNVELDGEAYFEVAKSYNQPFHVILKDSASVSVLGTHFNVQAYKDEASKEITLLEGKIAVNWLKNKKELNPGMQAKVTTNSVETISNVDTEQVIGWKNGQFVFHDASIETIMRQVERWYDAKVIYQGQIKQQFNATIQRSEPLSKLLRLLELNGYVKFKIEKNIIYVLP
jgi:transmembrane sensor